MAKRKKSKNKYGIAIFNLGYRKDVHIKMEKFPKQLVESFTPTKRDKRDLVKDFLSFIKEVNELQDILEKSGKEHKQYHFMFGDINTETIRKLKKVLENVVKKGTCFTNKQT